jgi:hypothetical protein
MIGMDINTFKISEVMFMLDIMKADKKEWCKTGNDEDVIAEYDSIISKLESKLNDYQGINRAFRTLKTLNA